MRDKGLFNHRGRCCASSRDDCGELHAIHQGGYDWRSSGQSRSSTSDDGNDDGIHKILLRAFHSHNSLIQVVIFAINLSISKNNRTCLKLQSRRVAIKFKHFFSSQSFFPFDEINLLRVGWWNWKNKRQTLTRRHIMMVMGSLEKIYSWNCFKFQAENWLEVIELNKLFSFPGSFSSCP